LVFNASYIKKKRGGEFIDGRRRTLLGWFATLFPLLSPLLAAKPVSHPVFVILNWKQPETSIW
jgi:hypothetical protein